MIITATNPKGEVIYFNKDKHYYFDFKNESYKGVTSTINKCFPKFDTKKISKRVAIKNNKSVEQVLKEWKINRDTAADFGTKVHKFGEEYLLDQQSNKLPEATNRKETKYFRAVKKYIDALLEKNWTLVATELIVFDSTYQIAGTFDALIRDTHGNYKLIDWKTNKEFTTMNRWGGRGIGPLSHLHDCHLHKYGLQLNLYKHILLEGNYFPVKNYLMELLHVTKERVVVYKVANLNAEIELILKGEVK